ncbi:MAG: hypothetical protein J6Z12_01780 [Paludibacteraceae bacterium]|nr:hypothetical protein [Paludibacteraceae bacterium]
MASKRDIKKDIRALYAGLLEECLTDAVLYRDADRDALEQTYQKITTHCCDFLSRAGHTDGKENPAHVKSYYRQLGKELMQDVLEITQDLQKVRKQ